MVADNPFLIVCGHDEVNEVEVDEENITEVTGQRTNMLTCTWRRRGALLEGSYKITRFLAKKGPNGARDLYVEYYQLDYPDDLQQMLLNDFCTSFTYCQNGDREEMEKFERRHPWDNH